MSRAVALAALLALLQPAHDARRVSPHAARPALDTTLDTPRQSPTLNVTPLAYRSARRDRRLLLHDDVRWLAANPAQDDRFTRILYRTIILDEQEHSLLNTSLTLSDHLKLLDRSDDYMFFENYVAKKYGRFKRAPHSLISPFDMSRMFKKKKLKSKQEGSSAPSAAPLQSSDKLFGYEPTSMAASSFTPTGLSVSSKIETPAFTSSQSTAATVQIMTATKEPTNASGITATEAKPTNIVQVMSSTDKPTANATKPRSKNRAKALRKLKPTSAVPLGSRRETRLAVKKKSENETVWPVKHAAVVEGDIVLGGLMMVSLTLIFLA